MLNIKLLCVGKLKEPFYIAAASEYAKRLKPYYKLEVVEIAERDLVSEAGDIRAALAKGCFTVALCIEGEMLSSEELAAKIDRLAARGLSKLCFVVGGSDGLSESVKQAADLRLSMSRMTFPHHLARVLLLEQLYRAAMINGGGKYHK